LFKSFLSKTYEGIVEKSLKKCLEKNGGFSRGGGALPGKGEGN
jgi:hypothetical protein